MDDLIRENPHLAQFIVGGLGVGIIILGRQGLSALAQRLEPEDQWKLYVGALAAMAGVIAILYFFVIPPE